MNGTVGSVMHNPLSDAFCVGGEPDSGCLAALSLCEQAANSFRAGRLDEAASILENASRCSPRIRGIHFGVAVVRARQGRYPEAIERLDRELSQDVPHPRARGLRTDILARFGGSSGGTEKRPRPRLTLFTIPKAFTGHTGIIQRNALRSWLRLEPRPDILLLGDDPGVAEAAREFGVVHVPGIAKSEWGTPRIDSAFSIAQGRPGAEELVYVNADIVLDQDVVDTLALVRERKPMHLVVGRRWDFVQRAEIPSMNGSVLASLKEKARREGVLHPASGIDYFAFSKGVYSEIPPFSVGRTAWDNWLVWAAKASGAVLVDGTHAITCLHQEHSYSHVKGGTSEVWKGEEARRNQELAGNRMANAADADWIVVGGDVVPMESRYRLADHPRKAIELLKMRNAEAAAACGDLEEALDILEYIELGPTAERPDGFHFLKARTMLMRIDIPGINAALSAAIVANPADAAARHAKSALMELVDALEVSSPVRLVPENAPVRDDGAYVDLLEETIALVQRGNLTEALLVLDRAAQMAPGDPEIVRVRSQLVAQMGRSATVAK